MTALNERLREIGSRLETAKRVWRACNGDRAALGRDLQLQLELFRAIRVLVEQRDGAVGSYHITLGGTRVEASVTVSELDTAVLAAMDAPGKEEA